MHRRDRSVALRTARTIDASVAGAANFGWWDKATGCCLWWQKRRCEHAVLDRRLSSTCMLRGVAIVALQDTCLNLGCCQLLVACFGHHSSG